MSSTTSTPKLAQITNIYRLLKPKAPAGISCRGFFYGFLHLAILELFMQPLFGALKSSGRE
jgi:hypothetical protein